METKGAKRWRVIKERIAAGLCRDCGEPRGGLGTNERCKVHADAFNDYQRTRRAAPVVPVERLRLDAVEDVIAELQTALASADRMAGRATARKIRAALRSAYGARRFARAAAQPQQEDQGHG